MKQSSFSLARKDEELLQLVNTTDQKTLALWAIDGAERVMPFFEEPSTSDHGDKPRRLLWNIAMQARQRW